MKVHILFQFKEHAWGGGNQFLKNLRNFFIKAGNYTEKRDKADVLLLNSYHCLPDGIKWKIANPKGKLVWRLGPVFYLHRGNHWKLIDKLIVQLANRFADLVVMQSNWSLNQALMLGFNKNKKTVVIYNATDMQLRFRRPHDDRKSKISLIASSWSTNIKKGVKFYKYLDENLNFEKYEMTFVGNTNAKFKNIRAIGPVESKELSDCLSNADIFVSGVEDDACSNSIIEAKALGLPIIALDSGANGEIIAKGGELFKNKEELMLRINQVAEDLNLYRKNVSSSTIIKVGQEYLESMEIAKAHKAISKAYGSIFCFQIHLKLFIFKLYSKLRAHV